MKLESKDGEAVIWIYDAIGEMFGPDAVTAKDVRDQLGALGAIDRLTVRINSPGGVADDAIAIHTLLKEFKTETVVKVDGIAASAAALISMAGDHIEVALGGSMMIHNPWGMAVGDARELRRAADVSDHYGERGAEITAARTGQTIEAVHTAMDAETYFTADEAVEFGLADVAGQEAAVASQSTEKLMAYALEVAKIAALALVTDADSPAGKRLAAKALDVGRQMRANARQRQLDLAAKCD